MIMFHIMTDKRVEDTEKVRMHFNCGERSCVGSAIIDYQYYGVPRNEGEAVLPSIWLFHSILCQSHGLCFKMNCFKNL